MSSAKTPTATAKHNKATALCWAARIIPLIVGVLVALWSVPAFLIMLIDGAPAHDLLWFLVGLAPLSLAVIAWRQHLIGGLLVILFAVAFSLYIGLTEDYEFQFFFLLYTFPLVLVFFAGGVLHLVVWWREKRGKSLWQQA